MNDLPVIAYTCGEPAGIGPDLAILLADTPLSCRLRVLGNLDVLHVRANQLAKHVDFIELGENDPAPPHTAGRLAVQSLPVSAPVTAGQLDHRNSQHVLALLDEAANGCMQGRYSAMTTGPVHKGIINDAGIAFTGHTEYLAACAGVVPVMMLTAGRLRVALVTTHLALRAVPDAITREAVRHALDTVQRELIDKFGIGTPRIAVCGLNPHAGEGGHLGREEIEVIAPVVAACVAAGIDARGPLPADTVFTPQVLDGVDAVIAMYHDQGLTALKALGFGRAINITLGLPFLRTSVDHGTALELAGTGRKPDGTLSLVAYCAWLLKERGRGG